MDKRKVVATISLALAFIGLIVSLFAKIDFVVTSIMSSETFEIKNVVMGGWNHLTFGTIIAFTCGLVNLIIVEANKEYRIAQIALAVLMIVGAICLFCYEQNNEELAKLAKTYERSTTSTNCAGCVVAGIMYILGAVLAFISAFMSAEDLSAPLPYYYNQEENYGIQETKAQIKEDIKKEEKVEEKEPEVNTEAEEKEEETEVTKEENNEDVIEEAEEKEETPKEEEKQSLASMLEKERFQEEEITQIINLELSDVQVIGDMMTIKRTTTYNIKFVYNVSLKRNLLTFVFFGKQYNVKTSSLDFDEAKAIYDALNKYSQ